MVQVRHYNDACYNKVTLYKICIIYLEVHKDVNSFVPLIVGAATFNLLHIGLILFLNVFIQSRAGFCSLRCDEQYCLNIHHSQSGHCHWPYIWLCTNDGQYISYLYY